LGILNDDRRLTETLIREGSCDCSYSLPGLARFRVNIFSQRSTYSIVMRKLETEVPTIEELGLPEIFNKMAEEQNGIVFITGATGSGKSTTLAAILEHINQNRAVNVITLEDPVEFLHTHDKATFNQRELRKDFPNFATGLRAALRQSPKVILIGEMRDRETVEIGLNAAETGHLVLTSLHTINSGQTVNRLIGMFDKDEEGQVRSRLADTVRWIVCQRLVPKIGGGRQAVMEIMGTNLRVKDSILHGEREGKTFYEISKESSNFGWRTFDDSLIEAYENGSITKETAETHATIRANVGRGIDKIKSIRGQKTSDIDELKIDRQYEDTSMRRAKSAKKRETKRKR
jgi:twitching motility protein PilT